MLAVLVDRDQRVVVSLLYRHAAIEKLRVRALGDQPFRIRVDAGFVEQGRHWDAGPFGVGHEAVDHEFVFGGINVRYARMIDGEVEFVRRNRAVEQLMRRARVRVAEFAGGIAQRPHDVLFEPRRHLPGRHDRPKFETPRLVLERLGRGDLSAVEASLKRLKTEWIDIYYLHR